MALLESIFVDAGFLIALSDGGEPRHDEAAEWVEILEQERQRLVTTEYCLIELVNHHSEVGRRHLGHQIVCDVREHRDFSVIPSSSNLFERGLKLHLQRDDKSWGLVDCISLVVMRDRSIRKVLTFDSDFAQAGKKVLTSD